MTSRARDHYGQCISLSVSPTGVDDLTFEFRVSSFEFRVLKEVMKYEIYYRRSESSVDFFVRQCRLYTVGCRYTGARKKPPQENDHEKKTAPRNEMHFAFCNFIFIF